MSQDYPEEKQQESLNAQEGMPSSMEMVETDEAPTTPRRSKERKTGTIGTGEHHKLRATSTDSKPLQPICRDSHDEGAPQSIEHEPEDTLPDQLDHNR